MTKLHRKDLKHDEIQEKLGDAFRDITLHSREVVYIIILVLAIGAIAAAWYYYEQNQRAQSQALLADAMEKYNTTPGQPQLDPSLPKPKYSYNTDAEKYQAALTDFEKIASKYGNTPAGEMARYYAGASAFYLKQNAKAEDYLKQSTRISDKNILYYLSRTTLADLYNDTGKSDQAIQLLKEAVDNNKEIVPQENLLMELGESYKKAGKIQDAENTYRKILDDYKDSPVSYQAQIKMNELKVK